MSASAQRLETALARLEARNLKARIGAVEELAHVVNEVVDRVVGELEKPGDARFMIFERLGRFGTTVVEPLEQLLNRSDDHELQVLAAAALLTNGSRAGLQNLLRAVSEDDPLICVSVRVLTVAGIAQAAESIEVVLMTCDLKKTAMLECLVEGLKTLGKSIPDGVLDRLRSVEPSWLRDSFLA